MDATLKQKGPIVSSFPPMMIIRCRSRRVNRADWSLTDRQERIPWWNQTKIQAADVLLVGCGGLGSNQAKIFVQMGFREVAGVEPDRVEDSNRNRQLFTAEDVGLPKAHRLMRNIAPYAVYRTVLRSYFMTFQEWAQLRNRRRYSVIACGVDCLPTMLAVSEYGWTHKTPVIYINVSRDGEACRLFIQRCGADDPCFACYQPGALDHKARRDQPCVPSPAIGDILHVAIGLGARAAVGEILGVPISDDYNCRDITFGGFDIKKRILKRAGCPLCGGAQ